MFYLVMVVHLLGAAIWTGGHIVLSLTVLPRALKAADPGILLRFEQEFERVGMPALVAQVLTGLWLAHDLEPEFGLWFSFSDMLTTGIAVKLLLLGATAGLALNARFRVIPHLSAETLPLMGWHIRAVTVISVLFVMTGAYLRTGGI
ncbi:CopD family protein [Aliiroseovarius sp. KMU-50]|uniref:CopD family protein n=1 Tax=Aliiroseovarius salicola TaxID=3009082 RepID=A0ABT4VYZ2_9RHOB|nr:CopD family protein [Aliiroseovarius sp. KMU-50]MDA5093481.1 CopD family protein [Aliiroseovarius sp. KMU-50]